MVMAAAIAVFLAGLMVGRTPEYLGKKIGPAENKMIMQYALAAPLLVLPLTAIAVSTRAGLSGLTVNGGPPGLTEILFAYNSCFANNGQNFAGLSANTPFYNLTTALAMMVGRFGLAIAALALAGSIWSSDVKEGGAQWCVLYSTYRWPLETCRTRPQEGRAAGLHESG
jgi:K+-transporting ATPase ATPase A chain